MPIYIRCAANVGIIDERVPPSPLVPGQFFFPSFFPFFFFFPSPDISRPRISEISSDVVTRRDGNMGENACTRRGAIDRRRCKRLAL